MITDCFLIKSEYYQMQEDNDEQDFVDKMFKHDSKDSTVCNYISDKSEDDNNTKNDNDAEDDNNTEDVKNNRDIKDNKIISKANHLCSYHIQHKPG